MDFNDVKGVPKDQHWRHAIFRGSVVLSSKDNAVMSQVRALMLNLKTIQTSKPGNDAESSSSPVMDARDSARYTQQAVNLSNLVNNELITKTTFDLYSHKNGNLHRCFKKAQDCHVKAYMGIASHSQYDITREEWEQILGNHDCDIVISTVHFDPSMLSGNDGTLNNIKAKWNKRGDRIYFSFVGDPCLDYSHKFSNYWDIITRQSYMTPQGVMYIAEKIDYRMNTLFIKYTAVRVQPLNTRVNLSFSFWPGQEDIVVVWGWVFDSEYLQHLKIVPYGSAPIGFKRKVIAVPSKLIDAISVSQAIREEHIRSRNSCDGTRISR